MPEQTVWIVEAGDYDSTYVAAVYDTEQAANEHANLIEGWVTDAEVVSDPPEGVTRFTITASPTSTSFSYVGPEGEETYPEPATVTVNMEAGCESERVQRTEGLPAAAVSVSDGTGLRYRREIRVIGINPEAVWEAFAAKVPEVQEAWEAKARWEHAHPYKTVEVPKGIYDGFTGSFLLSFSGTLTADDFGEERTSRTLETRTRPIVHEDKAKRIWYVEADEAESVATGEDG